MLTAADIQTIRDNDPGAVLPGIDTMTGNPYAASSLLDVSKITQNTTAPYYYSPTTNIVYVNQAGAVLSGINFGSATVMINADNVTIKDSTFAGTSSFWAVNQSSAVSGAIVENNTFIGSKSPTENNTWITAAQDITIEDNTFLDSPTDSITIRQGVVTGNYFSGEGYAPGAHADAIYVTDSTGPTTITDNFIDATPNADAPGAANSAIRITNEFGNADDVTVSGNYLLGGGFTVQVGDAGNGYTISNISIADNDIGFGAFSPYSPTTPTLATVTGTTIVDFSNPTASNEALAAYEAAGIPTANVVSGTSGGASGGGSAPVTILGNGFQGAHLVAGGGETNFVGGQSSQLLFGGHGANILTYLAIGDGGDIATAFDQAKDVIDLSHIDADITKTGFQKFTFIGTAPFSGGAQVRYQFNPANDTTIVQAALAGDSTADLTVTLWGLAPLTAANFALTPSQSSADLAAGAALTYSKVATAAGAPAEFAYTNVQGKAYTSYEQFSGATYANIAADDLNMSSSANELVLYDPSLTVMRGGGSETLTVAGLSASDPLIYHPDETIDATITGGEQFVFSAGFGKETINGFSASGASPDSIQLAKSTFSYLTPGMTQAEDLAAVMAQATRGHSGLTISDSQGDRLTIAGLTPTAVAANPTMFQFT
jgi:serralysin